MEEPAGGPPPPDDASYGPAPPESRPPTPQFLPPPPSWAPPPPPGPRPELRPVVSPPGHPLYVTYAVVMTVSYVATAVYGYLMMQGDVTLDERSDPEFVQLLGVVLLSVSVALALAFLVGVVAPKRPWGWVYKLVLISFGLTSCCLWPVLIPLLRRWLKPDMKRYYRMR